MIKFAHKMAFAEKRVSFLASHREPKIAENWAETKTEVHFLSRILNGVGMTLTCVKSLNEAHIYARS